MTPAPFTLDEQKAMIHACYRDLIGPDGETMARRTAGALFEQFTGRDDPKAVAMLLRDAWTLGRRFNGGGMSYHKAEPVLADLLATAGAQKLRPT